MDAGDGFPAIARATQRFLRRQRSTLPERKQQLHNDSAEERKDKVTQWMTRLGTSLDEDLVLINADVERIHASVARDCARVSDSVDAFTAELLSGRERAERRRRKEGSKVTRRRGVAVVVVKKPRAVEKVRKMRPSSTRETRVIVKAECSQAARLAKEAVNAVVIQRAARRFLYGVLYAGGREQLLKARRLRVAFQLSRWLVRWQIWLSRGRRLRRKLRRSEMKSLVDLSERRLARAQAVVEVDGKYGLAKEFHRLRLVGLVMLAWIHTSACRDEGCCTRRTIEDGDQS